MFQQGGEYLQRALLVFGIESVSQGYQIPGFHPAAATATKEKAAEAIAEGAYLFSFLQRQNTVIF